MKSFLLSCALMSLAASAVFAEPSNLSLLKNEIQQYHDSGTYQKELAQVIQQADRYILKQVSLNNQRVEKKNLAIILDIDETSLSNYNNMIKREFVGNREQLHQETLAANAPVIEPMLALYNNALKNNVKVFFVTGRNTTELEATKINLTKAGYKDWAGIYLKPVNYSKKSVIPFKTHCRAEIRKQGYTIIATIGDQYSDLVGGYAKRAFKLPNPFYFLP